VEFLQSPDGCLGPESITVLAKVCHTRSGTRGTLQEQEFSLFCPCNLALFYLSLPVLDAFAGGWFGSGGLGEVAAAVV
jgi:hypothetical protein